MTNNLGMPAYTTREVRNYGLFKAGSLYKYLFTREDNLLLNSGAIELFPFDMCKLYTSNTTNLDGKEYEAGSLIDYTKFDDNTLKVLIKTNVIKCELKEEFKDKEITEIIKLAQLYNCVGDTFKNVSNKLELDFDTVKEKFELKQGGQNKKVKSEDIITLQELLGV